MGALETEPSPAQWAAWLTMSGWRHLSPPQTVRVEETRGASWWNRSAQSSIMFYPWWRSYHCLLSFSADNSGGGGKILLP